MNLQQIFSPVCIFVFNMTRVWKVGSVWKHALTMSGDPYQKAVEMSRAASHYALSAICHIQVDCITLLWLHPCWNHYPRKCKWNNGNFHAYVCVFLRGESPLAASIILVVVPQPVGFCILKKRASHSAWLIFPALTMSLPAETLCGKMQLPFFTSFTAVMPKQKADGNRVINHQ